MKYVINALEDVSEALRGEYEAKGGKFYLKTEGENPALVEANAKLTEFRDHNRALNTKISDAEAKLKAFEGIDPVEAKKAADELAKLKKQTGTKADDVAEIVKAAVAAAVKPLQDNEEKRKASEQAAIERADRELLKSTLTAAGIKARVDERALSDFVNRGMGIFKTIEGEVKARKGDAPIFQKDKPAEELTPDVWAIELQAEAPHLYQPSKGTGAGVNGGGGGTIVKKTIGSDPLEFGRNLEGIAKGEVIVQQ